MKLQIIALILCLAVLPATEAAAGSHVVGVLKDTYITQAAPSGKHGSEPELYCQAQPADSYLTVIHFDLSSIPAGATITSATAQLYVSAADLSGLPSRLHRVTDLWTEPGADWTILSTRYDRSTIHGFFTPDALGFVPVDITGLVQNWVDGVYPNHGVAIVPTSTSFLAKYTSKEWPVPSQRCWLQVTTAETGMRIVTGSYTGNGMDNRSIPVSDFQPDVVVVMGTNGTPAAIATSTMDMDITKLLGPKTGVRSGLIKLLHPSGFLLGADAHVNEPSAEYHYLAVKASAGEIKVGWYTGNGLANQKISNVGFQPDYVLIMSEDAQRPVQTFSTLGADSTLEFNASGTFPNRITALSQTGFEVGFDSTVNEAGRLYHYLAFQQRPGRIDVGSYTGNGTDNRKITAPDFTPEYLLIKSQGPLASAIHRPGSLSGDASLPVNLGVPMANAIQTFDTRGFDLGSDAGVNQLDQPYHYLAFRDSVLQYADLMIGKTSPLTAAEGDTIEYVVYLANQGPDSAAAIEALDLLPFGVTYLSDSLTQGSYESATGIWAVGDLAPLSGAQLFIQAIVNAGTGGNVITNTASITVTSLIDPDPSNNSMSADLTVSGSGYRIKTGHYLGDGLVDRLINDVGFQPDFVIIGGDNNEPSVARSATMGLDQSKELGPNTGLLDNLIKSFVPDGFVLGNGAQVNDAGVNYYYSAFSASPDTMVIGSYYGDGQDNRDFTTLDFQPAYMIIMAQHSEDAMQRFAAEAADESLPFDNEGEKGGRIQDFLPNGFQIGNHNTVNENGEFYHYVAWNGDAGMVADSAYVGNGIGQDIAAAGFSPDYVILKTAENEAGSQHRMAAMTGDATLPLAGGASYSGGIETFLPDGFRIGADEQVNRDNRQFFWTAFSDIPGLDLSLRKEIVETNPNIGDTVSYRISVVNLGPMAGTGVRVTDFLPAGVTYLSDSTLTGIYDWASGKWDIGDLAVSDSAVLDIMATVNTGTGGSTIINTAQISASNPADADPANNLGMAGFTVQSADLILSKSVGNPVPVEGDTVRFTITVSNNGPNDATAIEVLDSLPAGITYVADSTTQGSYDDGTGVWQAGDLASGLSASLIIQGIVRPGTGGQIITNSAAITAAGQEDPDTGNNFDEAPLTVQHADLELIKTVDAGYPAEGEILTYTINLANLGPDSSAAVQVLDILPPEVTYQTSTPSQGSYASGTGIWDAGTVLAGDTARLWITVQVKSGTIDSTITNSAAIVASAQADTNLANNTDSCNSMVVDRPTLIDAAGSLYPPSALIGESDLGLRIGLDNFTAVGVMLNTTSAVTFSDGNRTYRAELANPTYVPGNADNFTATFRYADVPADITAPSSYDLTLYLNGVDDHSRAYLDTLSTTGRNSIDIDVYRVTISADPLSVEAVNPGRENQSLLALRIDNEYPLARTLDTLVVTNRSSGPGSQLDLDAEIDTLYLYEDVDSNGVYSGPDDWVAGASFVTGRAGFATGGRTVPAGGRLRLLVVAAVDSFLARDGDILDASLDSPLDAVFTESTHIANTFSPVQPLNSFGYLVVDGMVAHQLAVSPSPLDTLVSGALNQLLFTVNIPQNGYQADTLTYFSMADLAGDFSPGDFSAVYLYRDDSDGIFDPLSDTLLGELVHSGDRFVISGISSPSGSSAVFHVAADVSADPVEGHHFRPSIPLLGVGVASGNDGPVDRAVDAGKTITIQRVEKIEVTSLALPAGSPHPGDLNVPLLMVSVRNNTIEPVQLDSLNLANTTGGPGTIADRDGEISNLRLYVDDGNGLVDAWDVLLAEGLTFTGGTLTARGISRILSPGTAENLLVACDVDSSCARDGDSLKVRIPKAGSLHVNPAKTIQGEFPIETTAGVVLDGLKAFQVELYPTTDSLIVTQTSNILIYDFVLPANGYQTDTLNSIQLYNEGSATSEHIARLAFYQDGGDGVFNQGGGDDIYIGNFLDMDGKLYLLPGLNVPLNQPCGSGTRFFVTTDLQPTYVNGASIQFKIPVNGINVTSGNDGPIDAAILNSSVLLIPKPNELTIFPYSVSNKRTHPGDRDILNFGLGCYNGFSSRFSIETIRLVQNQSAVSSELDGVFAYEDTDTNGLFDPNTDLKLATAHYDAGYYAFEDIGLNLTPRKITYLFIAYNLGLTVRDSVGIDFRINSSDHIELSNNTIAVNGEFPLNSPGQDFTDGMVSAQLQLEAVPAYRAARGEEDVLALSLNIPSNGKLIDRLHWLSVQNVGTATPGSDISILKLWIESGDHPGEFNPDEEEFIDFMPWNGNSWRNSMKLNKFITTAGIKCYVTFTAASGASDGATFRGKIPIGGVEVYSGNDGPINTQILNPYVQTISTDPLLTELETGLATYSIGQPISLSMRLRNVGPVILTSVTPSVPELQGAGSATLISGPVPASIDLAPAADTVITWTYSATTVGGIIFCGHAYNLDSSEVSVTSCTDTAWIQSNPSQVSLNILDTAPAGANRGQENIPLFKLDISYQPLDTLSATVLLNQLRLSLADGTGSPLAPNQVLDNFTVMNPGSGPISYSLADSAANPLVLSLDPPARFQPGDSLQLESYGSIADSAAFVSCRLVIDALADIGLVDANNLSPAVPLSRVPFPWSTNEITINSPAGTMFVSCPAQDTLRANTGQDRLLIQRLQLTNGGSPYTAGELLTDISFRFFDGSGSPLPPDQVIRNFILTAGQDEIYVEEAVAASSNQLNCDLFNPLLVQPGLGRMMEVWVDLKSFPLADAFYIAINDPLSITARDFNAGHLIEVAANGSSGFPLNSSLVQFQAPASGVEVTGSNQAPPIMMPSQHALTVFEITISHPDTNEAASIILDSLTIEFPELAGKPFFPGEYFSSLYVTCRGETLASDNSLSSVLSRTGLKLTSPLEVAPAGLETLEVRVNTKPLYPPGVFQARLERNGLILFDTNDGRRIFGISGDFPIISGPSALQVPSSSASCRLISKIPGNISATDRNLEVFELIISNSNPLGSTAIDFGGLTVQVEDMRGARLNISEYVNGAYLYDGDSLISGSPLIQSRMEIGVPDGRLAISAGTADTVAFRVDMNTAHTGENIRFVIAADQDVILNEAVTDSAIMATPLGGDTFPLESNPAHIVGTGAQEAFTNFPNPFAAGRDETTITFYLQRPSRVTLKVYTLWGAPVVTLLANRQLEAGLHQNITWDGRNSDGDVINNGVYYLWLEIKPGSGPAVKLKRKLGVLR